MLSLFQSQSLLKCASSFLRPELHNPTGFRLIHPFNHFPRRPRKATISNVLEFCKKGEMKRVAEALDSLNRQGVRPNYDTCMNIIKRCMSLKALPEARAICHQLTKFGFCDDTFAMNNLISMYCKMGSFGDALQVFVKMRERNVVSWTSIISGFVSVGNEEEGLRYFEMMRKDDVKPNEVALVTVIGICTKLGEKEFGRGLHGVVVKLGFAWDEFIASGLIKMYAQFDDCVDDARGVFDEVMQVCDIVTWNAMITAYAQSGFGREAMEVVLLILVTDVRPDNFTIASALKASAVLGCISLVLSMHCFVLKIGLNSDVFILGCVIDAYMKCGALNEARKIFDTINCKDIVTWNTMISGYLHNGYGEEALELFCNMFGRGYSPNRVTYASTLKAAALIANDFQCRYLHAQVLKRGFSYDVVIGTGLIDAYSKCLATDDAQSVYTELRKRRNSVSCNALIAGYSSKGKYGKAISIYSSMRRARMSPDPFTFTGLLTSCSVSKALVEGTQIHAQSIVLGLDSNVTVCNSLIDLYAKCGSALDAFKVFVSLDKTNSISWAAIISSFAKNGEEEKALKCFIEMLRVCENFDEFPFSGVLKACSRLADIEIGMQVHALAIKAGLEPSIFIGSGLIDMYLKCGHLDYSLRMFNSMPAKNVVSYNSMISGLAQHNHFTQSLQLFDEMQTLGITPTSITFNGVLSACCHAGLVDEGRKYFHDMISDYEINPTIEHYTCMIHLYGRAGCLDEAETLVMNSLFASEAILWRSLLSVCGAHGNAEVGKRAAVRCLQLEPNEPATYVILSNLYASKKLWHEVASIRKFMKERGIEKESGWSWVDVKAG